MQETCDHRNRTERHIDSLDTPGGHILIWIFLILIGIEVMVWTEHPQVGIKIVEGGMIALATGLKFGRSNAARSSAMSVEPTEQPPVDPAESKL